MQIVGYLRSLYLFTVESVLWFEVSEGEQVSHEVGGNGDQHAARVKLPLLVQFQAMSDISLDPSLCAEIKLVGPC